MAAATTALQGMSATMGRGGGGGAAAHRKILITGVSKGLGKALALEMAKRGHTVIGCSRSQDRLDSLKPELSASSDNHLLLTADVSSNSSLEELARMVKEKKGVPDIIVNNAGTINNNNRLWDVPAEEFDSVIDTNVKGTANVMRHFLPLMIENKQGIIVNMSSGWGRSAAAQVAPYCASKWAVEGLSRSVAKEVPSGIAVVALNPGVINTDMLASCFGTSASLYQMPESWAPKAAAMILNLTAADNGGSLSGRVFYPTDYGADPSGAEDSSDAIQRAVWDAFGVWNGGRELLKGVTDLGGVVIDLKGGNYKISRPIRFPASGGGNLVFKAGTLRASDTFPGDRHLIELWSPKSQKLNLAGGATAPPSVDIYYEAVTVRDVLFDSNFRGGGFFAIDAVRIRIFGCFFLHFTTQGITIQKGHETLISSTFLGHRSTIGGDRNERHFTGTAIDLSSNDNVVTDVVIFSAAVGIVVRGQANVITGVHCYNKATAFGGIGIWIRLPTLSQTRIDRCYLDYNAIVMEDPFQVHVTNGFFLGDANIVLRSVNGRISGVNIVDNMFSGDPKRMHPIIKLEGKFTAIDQVVIERNNVKGMKLKSTSARLTVAGNGTKWVADFSPVLVFPNRITHFHYSFYYNPLAGDGFAAHAVTNVSHNAVVVESDRPVNGLVSVAVDQYNMVGERAQALSFK